MTVVFPELGRVGRLRPGNQLFQMSATLGLARARGEEPLFPLWPYAQWFCWPSEWFSSEPMIDGIDGTHPTTHVPHIDPRAKIYLQDRNLFSAVMDEVRDYCAPSVLAMHALFEHTAFWQLPSPVLSCHVRRGDNVYDPATPEKWLYHPVPPDDYYKRAIELMRPHAASVAIFGDDPTWNRANLDGDYFHKGTPRPKENEPGYDDPPMDWVDWFLLVSCDAGHIVSNSTYGIFAALVDGGPTVAPWPIYGPALDFIDARLMLDPGWTVLPC